MKSISAVEVIRNGSCIMISNRAEVERAIMDNNKKRFTLAHQSPIMSDLHLPKFGAFGNTRFCQDLLNGLADLSDFPEEIATMLRLFQNGPQIMTNPFISTEWWQEHWKSSKERIYGVT